MWKSERQGGQEGGGGHEEDEEEERAEDKKGDNGRGEGDDGHEEWMEVSQYAIMEHEKEKIRDEPRGE